MSFGTPAVRIATFIFAFAIIGTIALLLAQAAISQPHISIEPETGLIADGGRAKVITDTTASRQAAVLFTSADDPPTGQIKPPLRGLIDRNPIPSQNFRMPPSSYLSVINAAVVNVKWADIQPNNRDELVTTKIDNAIEQVRTANRNSPGLDMRLRLRVFSGRHAPAWARHLESPDGAGVMVKDPFFGADAVAVEVGRFWTPTFGNAYANLQTKLAAKYDDPAAYPEIAEVVVSRCSLFYPEPFIRGINNQYVNSFNVSNLLAAGYTLDKDKTCQRESMAAHDVWKKTSSQFAFNPYEEITSATSFRYDTVFTKEAIDYCRTTLGRRCVLGNYSIRHPALAGHAWMIDHMRSKGAPISYQTAVAARIGSWRDTLQWAIDNDANSVELVDQADYDSEYPLTELQTFDQQLEANPL